MFVIGMMELSTNILIWLPICLAAWVSFVKNSIQAAGFLFLICLITGRFELVLAIFFLLFVSLLIPKPNPRHQKRRIQITKALYVLLIGYASWILSQHVPKPVLLTITTPNLDLCLYLIAPVSFFVFVIFLLFTRHHVR